MLSRVSLWIDRYDHVLGLYSGMSSSSLREHIYSPREAMITDAKTWVIHHSQSKGTCCKGMVWYSEIYNNMFILWCINQRMMSMLNKDYHAFIYHHFYKLNHQFYSHHLNILPSFLPCFLPSYRHNAINQSIPGSRGNKLLCGWSIG